MMRPSNVFPRALTTITMLLRPSIYIFYIFR